MLTEQDLNRIKGLVHFLNGEGKPVTRTPVDAGSSRRVGPAVEANLPRSGVKFITYVFDSEGSEVGKIKAISEGTKNDYAFFIGS